MKSDGFGVLLVRGFVLVRHIGRNLKIALVLGVVCIGVEGFFFGLLFLLLLRESIEAAACRQRNQGNGTEKRRSILCDLVFFGRISRFFRFLCGFLGFFLGFQPVLFCLRRRFFFSV